MNVPLDAEAPANPFPGIEPFAYRDRRVFFARNAEVRALMRLIVLYRGVLLYGPSQRGKSSLTNAGLIPAARAQGYQPERIRLQCQAGAECVVERIADGPASFLPSAFAPDDDQSGQPLVVPLDWVVAKVRQVAAAGRPRDAGDEASAAIDAGRPRRLLLIFDQFEEWITAFEEAPAGAENDAARLQASILHAITDLINDHSVSVKVVLAFREDYLPQMEPFLLRCPTLGDHYLRLGAPSPKRLYKLIRGPFMAYRGRYPREIGPSTAKVIQRQFDDGHGGEVSLTELQIVCRSLVEQPDLATWLKPGEPGVRGILREYFRSRLDVLPEPHREPAIALLGALVSGAGTRKTVDAETLLAVVSSETREPRDVCAAALRDLELQARLVRREHRRDMDYLEISSEFLVDWIKEQAAARRDRLKEQRLQDEQARIAARARAEANASAQRRLLRWTAGFAAVCLLFLIAAVAATTVAVDLGNEHVARLWVQAAFRRLERDPEASLRLALGANAVAREKTPAVLLPADMALLRAVRATAHIETTEQTQAVASAMSADGRILAFVDAGRRTVEFRGSAATGAASSRPLARPGNVQGLAFLRGAEVLVVHGDGAFEMVRPAGATAPPGAASAGASPPPAGRDARAQMVRWAVDAERQRLLVVSASAPSQSQDGQWHPGRQWVSLADVPAGRWLRHDAVGTDDWVTLAPNGRVYAVTSGAATVRLHDADGRQIATTRMDGLQSVHPSGDGKFVLGIPRAPTAAAVYVWHVSTNRTWRIPIPGSGRVVTALVSPDSRSFAILQTTGLAQAWDLRARGAIHAAPIRAAGIAFSDDGSELLAWDDSGAAEAWALGPSERRLRLVGHREPIVGMIGRAGGRVVTLTASTMRTWTRAGLDRILHARPDEEPVGLAVGPDGRRVVLASSSGSDEAPFASGFRTRIAIRSVSDGGVLSELTEAGVVTALAYAPTRGRVAAGFDSGRLLVLEDGADRSRDIALDGPGPITAVAFSGDGRLLAYASQSRDKPGIVVRDLARKVDVATNDLAGLVTALRFSADRRRLAVSTFEPGAYTTLARDPSRPSTRFRILVLGDRDSVTTASPRSARPLLTTAGGAPRLEPGSRVSARLTDRPAIVAIGADLDVAVTTDTRTPLALWPGLDPDAMRRLAEQATTVAMSSDGRFFATGNLDGAVKLFSADGRLDPVVLQESGSPVAAVAFSPASDHLASVTIDGTITVYSYGRNHLLDLARRVSSEEPTERDCAEAALDPQLCREDAVSWRSVLHRLVPGRR